MLLWLSLNIIALLLENCLLLGTDIAREKISKRIFAPNGGLNVQMSEF